MFFSQYFSFPCQCHSTIAPYSSIHLPPALYNSFSPSTSVLLCQYHSNIAPYSFIHLPPAVSNFFLLALQSSPVSIIPPLLHTHSFIYHPHSIMFFSQYFSFPRSVSFHHCSILIHSSTTHTYNVFLPALQFFPVSIIPPLLHTHSFTYCSHCIIFFSQYFSFPLSVSFHHRSILVHSYTTYAL